MKYEGMVNDEMSRMLLGARTSRPQTRRQTRRFVRASRSLCGRDVRVPSKRLILVSGSLSVWTDVLIKPIQVRFHSCELHLRLGWAVWLARQYEHSRSHTFDFQRIVELVAL